MARFGQLMLDGGAWDGRQLVPADWVRESTRRQEDGGPPVDFGYGYLWWVELFDRPGTFCAAGYGGQIIAVFPELDGVVVVTANEHPTQSSFGALRSLILPALEGTP